MKNKLTLLFLSLGITTIANAQNVWNGTTIPSTTISKVGAGTNAPTAQLHVGVANTTSWNTVGLQINSWSRPNLNGNIMAIFDEPNTFPAGTQTLLFAVDKTQTIIPNRLRIGATAANGAYASYKLSVDGDMIAKRCVIQVSNWADYVFENNYALPALSELELYVAKNKHLPGVPSATEVQENGVEMGEMNKVLLQKVEELTLYIIEQNKKIERLEEKIDKR